MLRKLFKNKGFQIWFAETVFMVALIITVAILCSVFYDALKLLLWRETPVYVEGYSAIYDFDQQTVSKKDALNQANETNELVCEEGTVLLKNDDRALPLDNHAKVSVFGKNSVDLVYGGSGSAQTDNGEAKTIYDSLKEAGFRTNPVLQNFYNDPKQSGNKREANSSNMDSGNDVDIATGETPYSSYTSEVRNSYGEYHDAAIIVLSRISGEGFDLPRWSKDDANRHYLEPDPNEADLIRSVTAEFEKVIVVINSPTVIEMDWAEDGRYGDVSAVLWIGAPGNSGILALGRILKGEVTPSGRTVDTWASDLLSAPSVVNFGTGGIANADAYYLDGKKKSNFFVHYEEGIYVGYRYYETRAVSYNGSVGKETETFESGEQWYNNNVVYPFGYGLSYATFSQEITAGKFGEIKLNEKGQMTAIVSVKVTNTGDQDGADGKDVVQIYATPPYREGGIEKSHTVLAGFAKTDVLKPGESETVDVELNLYDLASYDYDDKNGNGHKGYELEAGDYVFRLAENAHETIESFTAELAEDFLYQTDPDTGYPVENRFEDADDQLNTVLSRSDWKNTFPTSPTDADREKDKEFFDRLTSTEHNNPEIFDEMPVTNSEKEAELYDLVSSEDYEGYYDRRWENILDALTVDEMADLCNHGAFQTAAMVKIGKSQTVDCDGPGGFTNFLGDTTTVYDTCAYASEVVLASTWNTDLAFAMGQSVGEEALWGNAKNNTPYSGWYAPGANLHRNAFGGRNIEYFSEDGLISGLMAANEIKGCSSKGLYCFVKHFVANDQETHRSGLATWLTEQALRELYLKPFEKAVKIGNTRGVMSAFTRLGTTWTGGDYRLLTEVLRNEWGFRGTVICDFNTVSFMNNRQMIYAGGDLNLSISRFWDASASSVSDVTVLRRAVKNILYTYSTSNAMNGKIDYYMPPSWIWILVSVGAVILIGLTVWGVFAVKKALKSVQNQSDTVRNADV